MNSKIKVSVIVPVYNAEKYLKKCLNSLVNQTLKDIEIIIINDGSIDKSQDIIDKYVKSYKDKIVAIKQNNGGVSSARNKGLHVASGEFIGFVDSDDYVEINMFEELYNSANKEKCEIVVSGYFMDYPNGRTKNMNLGKMDNYFKSLKENPDILLSDVPFAWNKLFKKSLIDKNNIEFEKFKIFEDLLFTYKSFLVANKIGKVDKAFYHYCRRKEDSVTGDFNKNFYDLYDVLPLLKKFYHENSSNKYDDYLTYIAVKHLYLRFNKVVSLKYTKLKYEYMKDGFNFLNKFDPNWKHNLYFGEQDIAKKEFNPLYLMVKPYLRKLRSIKKKINRFLGPNNQYMYTKKIKKPLEEKSFLFFPQQGNDINGNLFYLIKELNKEDYSDYTIYISVKSKRVSEFKTKLEFYNFTNYKIIEHNSKEFYTKLAVSKYIITDTSLPILFQKRKGQVYFNTWHGTPLKTLGKSVAYDYYNISNVQKNFIIADYLLYPNEFMRNIMVEDYMLKPRNNQIILNGYPRNSAFFEDAGKTNKKIRIAYMPTWRGRSSKVTQKNDIINILYQIDKNVKTNQEVYINVHPYDKDKIKGIDFKNIVVFPEHYETYDFLKTCDVLITDYSSVFFDFANTKKKIILFTYDKEDYLANRGMYLNIDNLPFPQVDTVKELFIEIDKPHKQYTSFLNKYSKYESVDVSAQLINILINEKQIEKSKGKDIHDITLIHSNGNCYPKIYEDLKSKINDINNKDKYYTSFSNSQIINNKESLKDLGIKYAGYYYTRAKFSKVDQLLLFAINRIPIMYTLLKKRYELIFKCELKTRYKDYSINKIIIFKEKNLNAIYTFAQADFKKVIIFDDLPKKLNISILDKYDKVIIESLKEKNNKLIQNMNQDKLFFGKNYNLEEL